MTGGYAPPTHGASNDTRWHQIGTPERYHSSMHESDVDTRLSDWARWCRGRFRKSQRCRSPEGLYRAPPMYDPPPICSSPANIDHVLQVERAVVKLLDPYRLVLVCAVLRRRFPVGANPHRANCSSRKLRSSYGGNEMAEAFG